MECISENVPPPVHLLQIMLEMVLRGFITQTFTQPVLFTFNKPKRTYISPNFIQSHLVSGICEGGKSESVGRERVKA